MDVAASEFYKGGKYDLDFKSPDDPSRYISSDKLADLYKGFVKDYPGGFSSLYLSLLQWGYIKRPRNMVLVTWDVKPRRCFETCTGRASKSSVLKALEWDCEVTIKPLVITVLSLVLHAYH